MKTVTVTVTYSDRADMCIETARRSVGCGSDEVVIVDNGSLAASREALEAFSRSMAGRVQLLRFQENAGTAAAFSAGIRAALELDASHIWILDDDNWADPGCLEACHRALERLGGISEPQIAALACHRDTDEHHAMLAAGKQSGDVFDPDGVFFGFDILRRILRKWRKPRALVDSAQPHELKQAPYGGLFAPSEVFRKIGLPREDFVLYFDDVEYTRRMRKAKIPLYFCDEARITDADAKWVDSDTNRYLTGMVKANNNVRTYYSYRNSFVLDFARARVTDNTIRFVVNFAVYSAYVAIVCARERNLRFLHTYLRGCWDGIRKNLGKRVSLQHV